MDMRMPIGVWLHDAAKLACSSCHHYNAARSCQDCLIRTVIKGPQPASFWPFISSSAYSYIYRKFFNNSLDRSLLELGLLYLHIR